MIWPKNSVYEFFRMMKIGLKAVITQSYTEANVKNGVQFGHSTFVPVLGSEATIEFALVTGSKPIAMKGRIFQYDGLGMLVEVFKDCTISGGTPSEPLNLNSKSDNTSEVRIVSGFTNPTYGDVFIGERAYLGDSTVGNGITTTVSSEIFGLETIYKENTTFIIRVTSIDATSPQRLSSYMSYYEGDFDLPDDS